MTIGTDPLESDLKQAIERFAAQEGSKLAAALEPILLTNHVRGRIRYFLEHQADSNIDDYIRRVADYYNQLHNYIYQVQHERHPDVWAAIYQNLKRWAFGLLRNKGVLPETIYSHQHHLHCATEAAMSILHAHFPYDTDFDPWAFINVKNAVNKYAGQLWKENEEAQNSVSVDQWETGQDNLPDRTALNFHEQIERKSELLTAIAQLPSPIQQFVVLRRYFDHWTFQQIAAELDKSVNAIYRLHFEALTNLRKILGSEGDNNN